MGGRGQVSYAGGAGSSAVASARIADSSRGAAIAAELGVSEQRGAEIFMASLYGKFSRGEVRTIITDVTMAASGIRKGALQRMGIEVKCYLQDERTVQLATEKGITRTQAGIRLAVQEHPSALYVFGNAPTALMELCDLTRKGKATPAGIIAAPVGFVHVQESKHMVKPFVSIPKLIIEGRKGGSNLAATLVNAILCYNDAKQLKPGRDV